ncbi:fimbrial protein [Leptothrix sp. BB-4]
MTDLTHHSMPHDREWSVGFHQVIKGIPPMCKHTQIFRLALFAAALLSGHAQAATLTMAGKVSANSCTVAVTGSGTITLPTISTSDLANNGDTAGETSFTISGSSCAAGLTSVMPYFDVNSANAAGRLATTVAGLELELRQGTTTLDLSKNAGAQAVTASAIGSNAFTSQFKVRYKRNQSAAFSSTGTVNVTLVYVLSYS